MISYGGRISPEGLVPRPCVANRREGYGNTMLVQRTHGEGDILFLSQVLQKRPEQLPVDFAMHSIAQIGWIFL